MTNTRITDPEILERRYPVLLREFSIRQGSGGSGKFRGGNGLRRVIEPLTDLSMNILSERRSHAPYGMAGGGEGEKGKNAIRKGGSGGVLSSIGGKSSCLLSKGDVLIIESPGGGGWGKEEDAAEDGGGGGGGGGGEVSKAFVGRANGSVSEYEATQFSA